MGTEVKNVMDSSPTTCTTDDTYAIHFMCMALYLRLTVCVGNISLTTSLCHSMAQCLQRMNEGNTKNMPVISASGTLLHELHLNDFLSFLHLGD